DPPLVDDAGTQPFQNGDEQHQQDDERHQRPVAHEPPEAAADGDRRRLRRGVAHGLRPRMATKAPSITTTTMITPSMIVVTLGSMARSVRSVRTRRSTKTATIGPTSPPRPPPSVTPPSTTA